MKLKLAISPSMLLLSITLAITPVNSQSAQAQGASPALRGPMGRGVIQTSAGSSTINDLGPDSTALPPTPIDNSQPGAFVNPPAAPPGALAEPIPPIETSTGQHTNISIPLDMNAATNGLLLNTTNPNAAAQKPKEPLTAVISNVEMTTAPQEIILGAYRGLQIHVVNGTDRPLLFNGDAAILRLNNENAKTITVRQVDDAACPEQEPKSQVIGVVKAGITVGAVPAVRDIKMQKGPILGRYGCDERRREDEQSRFGKRILWPGDFTDGVVYFNTDQSLRGGSLELPVCSLADLQDKTALSGSSDITGTKPLSPVAAGQTIPSSDTDAQLDKLPMANPPAVNRKKEHPHP